MITPEDPRLTAYALGEMSDDERRAFELELQANEAAQREVAELSGVAEALRRELSAGAPPALAPEQRSLLEEIGGGQKAPPEPTTEGARVVPIARRRFGRVAGVVATLAVAAGALGIVTQMQYRSAGSSRADMERAERASKSELQSIDDDGYDSKKKRKFEESGVMSTAMPMASAPASPGRTFKDELVAPNDPVSPNPNGPIPSPSALPENPFVLTARDAKSTFSIDVDTASYSMIRRMLEGGTMPQAGLVRLEEMVNYFSYSYPEPDDEAFSVTADTAAAPWAPTHQILRIGLKGRSVDVSKRPPCNLVFLVDVSGSMAGEDRIELLKRGLNLLVDSLDERDSVAIVTYAGSSGVVLEPTSGAQKQVIRSAIDRLGTGGSTNGAAGIQTAYETAAKHFVQGGSNRVVLATDGDFNVGTTSQDALVKLIEEKAKTGVFLSVLGFGTGNFRDGTMEKLADKGNGNYAYIDKLEEARKVLVEQAAGTLITIAKDVKIQVTFDPSTVQSFRLLGYENRALSHQDFADDTKDAGEIGAGHRVTALYEITPKKSGSGTHFADIALRYKQPDGATSRLIETKVSDTGRPFDEASTDFRFATAVAGFGMLLRGSEHKGSLSYEDVLSIARSAVGDDADGRRKELVRLVQSAERLAK